LKSIKALPRRGIVGLPVRMFGSVLGVVDDTLNFLNQARKYGGSPAVVADASSMLYGAGGAFEQETQHMK
jgi:hypothetical protein